MKEADKVAETLNKAEIQADGRVNCTVKIGGLETVQINLFEDLSQFI